METVAIGADDQNEDNIALVPLALVDYLMHDATDLEPRKMALELMYACVAHRINSGARRLSAIDVARYVQESGDDRLLRAICNGVGKYTSEYNPRFANMRPEAIHSAHKGVAHVRYLGQRRLAKLAAPEADDDEDGFGADAAYQEEDTNDIDKTEEMEEEACDKDESSTNDDNCAGNDADEEPDAREESANADDDGDQARTEDIDAPAAGSTSATLQQSTGSQPERPRRRALKIHR